MAQLTPEVIVAAIEGFESQKRRIDEQIAELRSMLDGASARPSTASNRRGRRMSAEGRARIAEAQRRRWAESKGETQSAPKAAPKAKRKLSAEGRAAIVAALKKRWAAKKAGSQSKTAKPSRTAKAAKRAPAKKATTKAPAAAAPTAA
jgi:DNA-binding protein HU-beta